ncbi:uncharacterized protein GGS25DRAFT_442300 [Hypoxylon fragiforme]|uniref:uncharacterized protein n=1 Tax=Hypoxylon fragiforme TaxID=63214 RepID=UPI0020C66214|nr:uncharacterized protein GGS25DRAFT_442300 [Hypoxylon fragiforme]KAI2603942.1 hypothetical protein GGS25DRAFT_442300 [Hypoxylon fragiforme]
MNAHALLTAQGWRGTGHTLHPTSDSTGLAHHILMKRNSDGSGLGSKKAEHKVEAWWLNAFDQALKGIDTKTGTMKQTLKGGALEKITAKNALSKYTGNRGLYSSFVKGGFIEGTVGMNVTTGLPTPPDSGTGTPVATVSTDGEETKEERKERREARREAKSIRRLEKAAKKTAKKKAEERVVKKVKAEGKKTRKAEKEQMKAGETKEERRARRDARRKRKEDKRQHKTASGG